MLKINHATKIQDQKRILFLKIYCITCLIQLNICSIMTSRITIQI